MVVSFIGYQTHIQELNIDTENITLSEIKLKINLNTLNEVVIKSTSPITFKKDTIEFNADSFKTKKNAMVEDLLKALPGLEIDENGGMTINGKKVDKLLVDGEPFFC